MATPDALLSAILLLCLCILVAHILRTLARVLLPIAFRAAPLDIIAPPSQLTLRCATADGLVLAVTLAKQTFMKLSIHFTAPITVADARDPSAPLISVSVPNAPIKLNAVATIDPVDVHIHQPLDPLKLLVRRAVLGGISDLEDLDMRIAFVLSIDFCGIIFVDNIQFERTVSVAELRAVYKSAKPAASIPGTFPSKTKCVPSSASSNDSLDTSSDFSDLEIENQSENANQEPNNNIKKKLSQISLNQFIKRNGKYGIPAIDHAAISSTLDDVSATAFANAGPLFPIPSISPRPITPLLRSIVAGLDFHFPSPPAASIAIDSIQFNIVLNGSKVAHGILTGINLSSASTSMSIILKVVPAIVSASPIRGIASTASGMLKGAISGTLNGILYGEWGAGATIVGVSNIRIQLVKDSPIPWLNDLLSVVELEHDIDAVRKLGSSAKTASDDLRESILEMAADILDVARRSGSPCRVM